VKLAIVTDEVSADPATAIELGVGWGIRDFELRGVFASRAPFLSLYEKAYLRDVLAEYSARLVALSPGLFKIPFPPRDRERPSMAWMDRAGYEGWAAQQETLRHHVEELLPASLEYAAELGIGTVAIFSFDRAGLPPGPAPEEVLRVLAQAAERAGAMGIRLALENEEGFWGDTGQRTAALVRAIGDPALGVNWDPGNAFCAGDEPFPIGYQAVRGLVRHVHFKDARREADGIATYVVDGEIDWAGQIGALTGDNYAGFISVETHLRPKVGAARELLDRLRRLIDLAAASPASSLTGHGGKEPG
jgi:sugar phosphate isomerase/epimerase